MHRESLSIRREAALIAFIALIVASTSLRNGFALDDVHIIFENARVHSLSSFWQLFGQTYWPPEEGASLYRPLTMLAFAAQWVVGGGSPLPFHITSALLYAAVCVALLVFAREVVSRNAALLAAALFAVHPVHVEVFANVVGQAEMWVALIALISVTYFIRMRKRGPLTLRNYGLLSLMYVTACLFKEHAIVLPAVFVAADIILLGRCEKIGQRVKALVPLGISLVVTAAIFVAIRMAVTGGFRSGGSNELFHDVSFAGRLLTMFTVVIEWLRLFFWPAQLSADYSFPRTRIATELTPEMLPGIIVIAACAFAAWHMRRSTPVVAFCLAWIGIALLIPSNLIIVTGFVLAERTLFLASAGVVILVAMGIEYLWTYAEDSRARRIIIAAAASLLVVAGAGRSLARGPVWKDNPTLFAQTVEDVPMSSRAHWMLAELLSQAKGPRAGLDEMMLAVALGRKDDPTLLGFAADQLSMAGNCPRATGLYLRALKITPENIQLRVNTSLCLLRLGRIDEARAVAQAGPPASAADSRIVRVVNISDSLQVLRTARSAARASNVN